jgi:hypothetical protein
VSAPNQTEELQAAQDRANAAEAKLAKVTALFNEWASRSINDCKSTRFALITIGKELVTP